MAWSRRLLGPVYKDMPKALARMQLLTIQRTSQLTAQAMCTSQTRKTAAFRKLSVAGVVTTLAGNNSLYTPILGAYGDGMGTNAAFFYPESIALDNAGNVFVADSGNRRIRKVDPFGVVTTLAGSGLRAYAEGVGTSASFKSPQGIAVDNAGNVYVTDMVSSRICKVTAAGVVSTLAGTGNGSRAYNDGAGASASFFAPMSVAVDNAGNLYVADAGINRIRKLVMSSSSISSAVGTVTRVIVGVAIFGLVVA